MSAAPLKTTSYYVEVRGGAFDFDVTLEDVIPSSNSLTFTHRNVACFHAWF